MRTYEDHETPEALRKPLPPEELAKVAFDWRKLIDEHEARLTETPGYNELSKPAAAFNRIDDSRAAAEAWQLEHPTPEGA